MKTATKDLRSPIAKARDKFIESPEGQRLLEASILKRPDLRSFLENRLVLAFFEGVKAAKDLKELKQSRPTKTNRRLK